jgi:hypothetical protein
VAGIMCLIERMSTKKNTSVNRSVEERISEHPLETSLLDRPGTGGRLASGGEALGL